MAIIIPPQDIPSELYDQFRAIAGEARPNDVVERRYPWRITQPATPQQIDVWNKFLYCTRCFGDQSPAMRQWWYEQSIPSGLFYYTYFMGQTLPIVHQGLIPAWCPEMFYEPFDGTKLNLDKWLEPVINGGTPYPDTYGKYWVNNKFYIRHYGTTGVISSWLQTRYFIIPPSFDVEVDLALSWTGRGTYRESLDSVYSEFIFVPGYSVFLGMSHVHLVPYLAGWVDLGLVTPIRITGRLVHGNLYRFRVKYDDISKNIKIYFNGELKLDMTIDIESQPPLQFAHWTDFAVPSTSTNTTGVIDNIIVRRLTE